MEACDFVVGDLGEDPCELGLRFNAVQFGRFDQGEGDGHGSAAAFGTGEHPIFRPIATGVTAPLLCYCGVQESRSEGMPALLACSQGCNGWPVPVVTCRRP